LAREDARTDPAEPSTDLVEPGGLAHVQEGEDVQGPLAENGARDLCVRGRGVEHGGGAAGPADVADDLSGESGAGVDEIGEAALESLRLRVHARLRLFGSCKHLSDQHPALRELDTKPYVMTCVHLDYRRPSLLPQRSDRHDAHERRRTPAWILPRLQQQRGA